MGGTAALALTGASFLTSQVVHQNKILNSHKRTRHKQQI